MKHLELKKKQAKFAQLILNFKFASQLDFND